MSNPYRALRHRNFRLFFFGQGTSVIGTWVTRTATSWLVYRLTGSALLLGLVAFSSAIMSFAIAPFAGVWVERMERRRLLVWTQVAGGLQSLALAALTLTHVITLWEVMALAALQGVINGFDMPGRHSFLVQMVEDRADLPNAIAINSSMANVARLVGPAIAGALIAAVGEGWCFFLDGVSYLAVVASLFAMRVAEVEVPKARRMVEQVREGWNYVRASVPIRTTLTLFSLVTLMAYSYSVLVPIFAAEVLHGGPHLLGWLMSASGVGALASAMSLAVRPTSDGLTKMLPLASGLLGLSLFLLGLSHTPALSIAIMAFVGFGMVQTASVTNTIIQSLCSDHMRARVMSFYTMAFFGAQPLGSLLAGSLAQRFGAPHTVMFTGTCCLAGALWISFELAAVDGAIAASKTV